jgi:hypothetical protein
MIHNYEKKPLLIWFGFLLSMYVATMLLGCKAKPIVSTDKTVQIERINSDSTSVTQTSKAIDDMLAVTIPPVQTSRKDCDSVCQLALDRSLSMLNITKQSGDIKYRLLYNKYTRLLTMQANIGQTENRATAVNKDRYFNTTRTVVTKIPVQFVPAFIKYSAWFGWLCAVCLVVWIIKKIYTIWLPKTSIT